MATDDERVRMSTPNWTHRDDATNGPERESRVGRSNDNLAVCDSATNDSLIADLGADGKSLWKELVDSFVRDSSMLVAISAAADARNADALAFAAHALKSSSAIFGLLALSSTADHLETAFQTDPESFDVVAGAMKLVIQYHRATEALLRLQLAR